MHFYKESVFISAIRSFCTSFAMLLGIVIAVVVSFMGLSFFSGSTLYPPKSELTLAPDAEGNRELLPSSAPVILRLDIHGIIGQGDLIAEKIENALLDSREGLLNHNRVKALLLHMNTPGGTVTDSDTIYRTLLAYKNKYQVPIYAYIDGLCASGGMYIACAADKIFASESSIIGSVGVVLGPTFNFSQFMQAHGVQSLTLTEGKDKDMLNPFRAWQPGEDTALRNILSALYDRFVAIVTTARPRLNKTKLIEEYGAQIFVGSQAEKFGYIDVANSDYSAALTALTQAAQFTDKQPYQVVQIAPPRPFLSDLANGQMALLNGKITHEFQISPYVNSEICGKFLYLYQPN